MTVALFVEATVDSPAGKAFRWPRLADQSERRGPQGNTG